jgi:hypothetical protein
MKQKTEIKIKITYASKIQKELLTKYVIQYTNQCKNLVKEFHKNNEFDMVIK